MAIIYQPQALLSVRTLLSMTCLAGFLMGCGSAVDPATQVPTTPVTPAPLVKPRFAYTGNQGASLSGFSVDDSTGVLTPLRGFPLGVGANPVNVTHDLQNRFLFVSDIAANMLHVYGIDASTGALSEISPSPYNTMIESETVVVDPSGAHVYLYRTGASSSYPGVRGNQLVAFNVSATGTLSPVPGSPYLVGAAGTAFDSAFGMLMSNSGKLLYLKDSTHLYAFGVDGTTGGLSLLQTLPAQQFGDIALDPNGLYLYSVGGSALVTYTIDPASGLLSLAKTTQQAGGGGAYTIAVSPNGKYAYTIEANNNLVSYAVSNGAFSQVGTVYSGVYGQHIAVDPSGAFVYVPQACSYCGSSAYNVVHEYAITASGALTPLATPTVAAGVTPWSITITSQ